MPVIKFREIELEEVNMEGAADVVKANVIGEKEGWPNYTLRLFRLAAGGYTPRHKHQWEHVNYIISGKGRVRIGDTVHEIEKKDFAFVPPGTEHQFENPYDEDMDFICIVPNSGR